MTTFFVLINSSLISFLHNTRKKTRGSAFFIFLFVIGLEKGLIELWLGVFCPTAGLKADVEKGSNNSLLVCK